MKTLHQHLVGMRSCVGAALAVGLFGITIVVSPVAAQPFAYVAGPDVLPLPPVGSSNIFSSIGVLDTATNTEATTIAVPGLVSTSPKSIATSPDGAHLYVSVPGSSLIGSDIPGRVFVIDTATNTVVANVSVTPPCSSTSCSTVAMGLAVTPDGSRVYVAVQGNTAADGSVAVMDTASNTVVATIPVAGFPTGVAITPDGGHVYVTSLAISGPGVFPPGSVAVIETATNTVVATVRSEHCRDRPTRSGVVRLVNVEGRNLKGSATIASPPLSYRSNLGGVRRSGPVSRLLEI